MPKAKLTIDVPEGTWIRDVSTEFPDATFRVVTAMASQDEGVVLLELEAEDVLAVLSAVRASPSVRDVELLWHHDGVAVVQLATEDPSLMGPALRAGIPLKTPFEIRDGTTTWRLSTTSQRLSAFGDLLDEHGIEYDVVHVRDFGTNEADHLLTDRQQQVLVTAVERGYYETPRRITLTELADRLDVSKSTVSDVLHRAEGSVLSWFVEEFVG